MIWFPVVILETISHPTKHGNPDRLILTLTLLILLCMLTAECLVLLPEVCYTHGI